ncbi:hypothetical protein LCGC14_3066720, partial [marine sediment metagenome]
MNAVKVTIESEPRECDASRTTWLGYFNSIPTLEALHIAVTNNFDSYSLHVIE